MNTQKSIMHNQPIMGINKYHHSVLKLPRTLSSLETFGFSLSGLLAWLLTAPAVHSALGPWAIFVWLPGTIIGMLLNFQVQALGRHLADVSGGTPNYTTKLLKPFPWLGCYAALGYFYSWAAFPLSTIILADLITVQLEPFGITFPEIPLKIGLTLLVFIMAFSGTRALGILHLCFIVPAVGLLLIFSVQGIGWLAFSPASPGFFPTTWPSFSVLEWAKWFFFAVFATCSCETASAFVADSRKPGITLRFLPLAAGLIPIVFLGSSWVLMRLATTSELDNTFKTLLTAATPFWGKSAALIVSLWISSSALLAAATAVCNSPRILYQLALDGYLSPVFAVVSRQGVLQPSLIFSFILSLFFLLWGKIASLVMVSSVGVLVSIIVFHFGVWLRRARSEVRWPWLSLGFCLVETFVLVVGGLAWQWRDFVAGLLVPIIIVVADAAIRRSAFPPFHPYWWIQRRALYSTRIKDFVGLQVLVIVILVCGASIITWVIKNQLDQVPGDGGDNLLAILLMIIAFIAVAIACWTTLPQIASIAEAREVAESRFITALDTVSDTVLVLNENGVITQANPAAKSLLGVDANQLYERSLSDFLSQLDDLPANWQNTSEQILQMPNGAERIIEITISRRLNHQSLEYIVFLRDISDRKQAEVALRSSESTLRKQATELEQALQNLQSTQAQLIQTEKMSSLGQLVAGVAHEINNPVNFIYGNLTYIDNYTQDLVALIQLYQQIYPNTAPEISKFIAEIELDFLMEDMPKMLSSMTVGTERICEIVLTLRNFSRVDEADIKSVDIHSGIDSTLLILQHRLKTKPGRPGIQVIKEYGDLPEIQCYPGQLNQVFMNILSNAIDALDKYNRQRTIAEVTEDKSKITICTILKNLDWVAISIKDNGPGMTDSTMKRIFDPFFTTKPVGDGTGLGLSISYQIVVDKHKGFLKCISSPNHGAEFLIEIPIILEAEPS